MAYVAKSTIYLNDAGEECAEDDPRVAQQVVVAGGTISDKAVARYGLEKSKSLEQQKADAPYRERGSGYADVNPGVEVAPPAAGPAPAAPAPAAPKAPSK